MGHLMTSYANDHINNAPLMDINNDTTNFKSIEVQKLGNSE